MHAYSTCQDIVYANASYLVLVANGDGTRTGTFQFFSMNTNASFVRFRSYWFGAP